MPWRDEDIARIKAMLLVHAIKASPGGYKLSNLTLMWIATHFEDAILPGNAQAMFDLIHEVTECWNHDHDYKVDL